MGANTSNGRTSDDKFKGDQGDQGECDTSCAQNIALEITGPIADELAKKNNSYNMHNLIGRF